MIIGGFMAAKTAISGVTAVIKTASMLTNPWVLVIAAVIGAIYLLIKNWDKVKETVANVVEWVKNAWQSAVNFFASECERIKTTVVGIWEAIKGAVQAAWDWIKGIGQAIGDFFSQVWEGIKAVAIAVWDAIVGFAQTWMQSVISIFQSIADYFATLWDNLKGVFQAFVDFFVALFTGQWDQLGEKIRGIWEAIKNTVKGAFDGIVNIAKRWVQGILNIFKPITDFFSGIGNAIASIFGGKQTLQVDVQTTGAAGDLGAGVDAGAADLPGHAAGGIFSRPHIAQIAEGGDAEAVMPINNKPASRNIWETAGRMAGFSQSPANNSNEPVFNISMPITISGNADAETVKQLKSAAVSMTAQMREMVRSELAAMQREKARLSFG